MRKIETYEGVIENGIVKLPENANIPNKTKVYILIPGSEIHSAAYVASPRLADQKKAQDFQKEVLKDISNAHL